MIDFENQLSYADWQSHREASQETETTCLSPNSRMHVSIPDEYAGWYPINNSDFMIELQILLDSIADDPRPPQAISVGQYYRSIDAKVRNAWRKWEQDGMITPTQPQNGQLLTMRFGMEYGRKTLSPPTIGG